MNLDNVQREMLQELTGVNDFSEGAFNVRANGVSAGRQSTETIRIEPKPGNSGFDIYIAPGAKADKVHIPVVITASGLKETVYNDFHIGDGAVVSIVAGCGIHNCG